MLWKKVINITPVFKEGLDIQERAEKAVEILTPYIGEDFPELESVIGGLYDIQIVEGAPDDNLDEVLGDLYDFADLNDIRIISGTGKTDSKWNVRRWISLLTEDACPQG